MHFKCILKIVFWLLQVTSTMGCGPKTQSQVVLCVVSPWSPWTRKITTESQGECSLSDSQACNTGRCPDPRLVIVGGSPSSSVDRLVESYPPSSSLSIPPLPESRYYHSLTLLPGPPPTLVVCGGVETRRSCISWRTGHAGWQDYHTMKQERSYHTAARTGLSILVMGGVSSSSRRTAELVPGGGQFDLQHDSYAACAVALEDTGEVVLIGGGSGWTTHSQVSRYSSTGFLGSLPDLGQKRSSHSCGSFTTSSGEKMLLVTGGVGYDGSRLSSTELLSLSSPTSWTTAASLPQAMHWHSVASLPGPAGVDIYCAGGWDGRNYRDEVLKYDSENNNWKQVGKMAKARHSFGMVGVP